MNQNKVFGKEDYEKEIPEFPMRLKVRAGLTGYAQVYGKYNTTPLDKLKLDLIYIVNYSLLLDVRIMLETVKILFKKESTEGFSDEESEDRLMSAAMTGRVVKQSSRNTYCVSVT